MRGVVKGGNNNSGGGTDGTSKSYPIETGETLAVNDVVEFVNNKVKKTKVVSVGGSATPQRLLSDAVSSGTFNLRVTDTTGILFTRGNISSALLCTPYTLVGSTINLGTPLVITGFYACYDAKFIDSDTILVFSTSSSSRPLSLIKYTDGTLTLLNTITLTGGSSAASGCIVPLSAREVLLVWITNSTDSKLCAQYFKIGTDNETMTMGTPLYMPAGSTSNKYSVEVVRSSSGRIVGVVGVESSIGDIYAFELSVNTALGITTLVQSRTIGNTVDRIAGYGMRVRPLSNDRILFVGDFNGSPKAIVIDSATLANGPRFALSKAGNRNIMIDNCDLNNLDRVAVVSCNISTPYTIIGSVLVINGDNTITEVSNKDLLSGYNCADIRGAYTTAVPGYLSKNTFIYITGTNTSYRDAFMVSAENNECKLTVTRATQPIGVVKGLSGSNATVVLKNSVLGGLSGLTPGALYYCDASGNITLNANTGLVTHTPIGRAISTTEILLGNLITFPNYNLGSYNTLKKTYATSGTVTVGRVVMLNSNGTITNYNGSGIPLGVYGGNGIVFLKGIVTGLSGLQAGQQYWLGSDGSLAPNDLGPKAMVGYGLSATELLVSDYIINRY